MGSSDHKSSYIPELDGLRGIAVLLVFFHHAGISAIAGGQIGVDIFFVLSGYLITTLLIREFDKYGRISLKDFYIRRALRLMPALCLLIAAFVLFTVATKHGQDLSKSLVSALIAVVYLSDFAIAFGYSSMGALSHTWSLAIEERFYLLFPALLVLFLGKRMAIRPLMMFLFGLVVLIAIHRSMMWGPTSEEIERVFYGFDTHSDGLLIGCLLGLISSWRGLPAISGKMVSPAAAFLILAILFLHWDSALYAYGLTLINISTAIVLAYILASRPAWLSNKALIWTGQISYGLYLWHNLIFIVVREKVTESSWAILILGGAASFIAAAASFYVFERPFLKLKERFSMRPPAVKDRAPITIPVPQAAE